MSSDTPDDAAERHAQFFKQLAEDRTRDVSKLSNGELWDEIQRNDLSPLFRDDGSTSSQLPPVQQARTDQLLTEYGRRLRNRHHERPQP